MVYITETVLEEIGIIEKGPQVVILTVVAKLKKAHHDSTLDTNPTEAGPSRRLTESPSEAVTVS